MTNNDLRKLWTEAGGEFHGPNIETATMPESKLLPFLKDLYARIRLAEESKACAWENNGILERARQKQAATIADLRERHEAFVRKVREIADQLAITNEPESWEHDFSVKLAALCDAELNKENSNG